MPRLSTRFETTGDLLEAQKTRKEPKVPMISGRWWIAFAATFVIMVVAPFPVYSLFAAMGAAQLPEGGSPTSFFFGVLVMKVGVAFGFVTLFGLAAASWTGKWWRYAAVWWLMYAIVEVGQAIAPGYSVGNAVAGIIAEAVYFPLSAFIVDRLIGQRSDVGPSG